MYIPGGLTAAHIGRLVNGCGQGICQVRQNTMSYYTRDKKRKREGEKESQRKRDRGISKTEGEDEREKKVREE